jgi:rod shape-determining protein MreC
MHFFRNYRTIIFIGVILAAALIILSFNFKRESSTGFIRKTVLESAAPLQNALNASFKSVSDAWYRYIALVGLEQKNKDLNRQVSDLQSKLIQYQEGYLEAQRLRNLLALTNDYSFDFVAARVIGREQVALSKTIMINRGTAHGLAVGMPVMGSPGLIGRITAVSWHAAKVLLIIDESSNIDAVIQRSRTQGIIRGAGSRGCVLKYISKTQDVKEGDTVISSGIGGVFPKGLMIGTVSEVNKQDAGLFLIIRVIPFIDFTKLEEVMVLASDIKDEDEGE